jgi:hypothetical protein
LPLSIDEGGSGGRVEVHDFDGACRVEREDKLLARLRSVRRGADGAFILDHGEGGSLWIHINGDAAFLWFCPDNDGNHPGFVPDGMWSGDHCEVRFLVLGGYEGDAIIPAWHQLLPVEAAYRAAIEYLHWPSLPASVTWFEL